MAVRGEGVHVWDADQKQYLDLAGSAAVNFIGHGVPEISAALAEQAAKLEFVHTSQFTTPIAEEYAAELLAFAGDHFRGGAVYFTCRRHGVLLIADEVMTGMGRTGRNFAVEHWNLMPDILVAAKGLSSGYAPLGAVIASRKVVDAIAAGSGAFLHGFTYNAHPMSLA